MIPLGAAEYDLSESESYELPDRATPVLVGNSKNKTHQLKNGRSSNCTTTASIVASAAEVGQSTAEPPTTLN